MSDSVVVRDHPKMREKWGKATKPSLRSTSTFKAKAKDKAAADDAASALEKRLATTRKQHLRLRKVAKKKDYSDKNSAVMLSALRSITINMIGEAEKNYHKFGNERAAYAYNALVSQLREIENDMRLVADLGHQADKVMDIFTDNYRNLARHMIDLAVKIKRGLSSEKRIKPRRVVTILDDFLKEHGQFMENSLVKTGDEIKDLMTEPVPSPKRKKRK